MPQPDLKPVLISPDEKKLAALARLSAKVSHDFNNILGAIEGYSTLILNTLKEDDPLRPDLDEIRNAVARAAELTKQLQTFSRKQTLQTMNCDLNAAVGSAASALAGALGKSALELELQPDLPALPGDPARLERLLKALALNAGDAMPDGGLIRITTKAVALQPQEVRSPDPARAGLNFIRLSVKDAGRGMSKEVIEHLFEPFFTTKEKGKGTGLGLAVVYGTVKQHNGWLTVETAEGRGTEFLIYLPAPLPTLI
ncbi:MAG: hypothetical protein A2X35_03930 [Elusimicrobia bacterium GWA2_61_42]|nr:MAG: hypothetical protein A2X35_03930 [Elusimicrobia bacterium GWA2_61_42]OGR76739.1 MAG: hypothetical protein A2X38_12855 [Elusimicrobia bacterium GWC2_61_25]